MHRERSLRETKVLFVRRKQGIWPGYDRVGGTGDGMHVASCNVHEMVVHTKASSSVRSALHYFCAKDSVMVRSEEVWEYTCTQISGRVMRGTFSGTRAQGWIAPPEIRTGGRLDMQGGRDVRRRDGVWHRVWHRVWHGAVVVR